MFTLVWDLKIIKPNSFDINIIRKNKKAIKVRKIFYILDMMQGSGGIIYKLIFNSVLICDRHVNVYERKNTEEEGIKQRKIKKKSDIQRTIIIINTVITFTIRPTLVW